MKRPARASFDTLEEGQAMLVRQRFDASLTSDDAPKV
jgi:hypothetical protein